MRERILRLCRRLDKFSFDEIQTISEINFIDLLSVLESLVAEKRLFKQSDLYFYNKNFMKNSLIKAPQFFQHHSKLDINYIIMGFCLDIEVLKMIDLFGFSKHVLNNFNQYFRTVLYTKQKNELLNYFKNNPKIAQERSYMDAKAYLYLYDGNLYVSDKLLKSPNSQKHTEMERLEIKNIYLRSFRKVLSRSFAHKFHLHLAEEIWKYGKNFKQQYSQLKFMMIP